MYYQALNICLEKVISIQRLSILQIIKSRYQTMATAISENTREVLDMNEDDVQRLRKVSMGCFYWEQKCRFEQPFEDTEGPVQSEKFVDWKSTMDWCEDIESAKTLKRWREEKEGYEARILFDRWEKEYVVLSTRLCEEYRSKNNIE